MKCFLTVSVILLAMIAGAQNRLFGHVVDGETNMPVAGTSVFITNTSLASVTNKEGYFEIRDIPSGIYKLIITHVGFETVTYDFSTDKCRPG